MDKPKRLSDEKYNRILTLAEKVKDSRPVEGEVIRKLIIHIEEMYEYLDYIEKGDDGILDDEQLKRLGVDVPKTPARTPTRRRSPARSGRGGSGPVLGRPVREAWQAQTTDISYLDDFDDPPF